MKLFIKLVFMILCINPLSVATDTMAIMNFKVNKLDPEAGEEIADLLSALLSETDGLKVVERTKLKELLEEQEMGQLGLSEEKTASKVQELYGATFFVTGKLFPVGKNLYLTTHLVSTETSIKKTMLAKMPMSDDYAPLVEQAAEKLLTTYFSFSENMKPKEEISALDEINEKVKAITWPRFAVNIDEEHIEKSIPDPAAQTEFIYLLQKLGAETSEYKQKVESSLLREGSKEMIISLENIDILILGEAFSTYASRRGGLVSCKARIEIKATVAQTGKLLCVGRETAAGVDASEALAAKKSLRLCADKLARSFLPEVMKAWEKQGL